MDTPRTLPGQHRPAPGPGAPAGPTGARRRPSGEPPPLPRAVNTATRVCGALLALTAALWATLTTAPGLRLVTGIDRAILDAVEELRWEPLVDAATLVVDAASRPLFRLIAWPTLVVLLATRRFQHLFATLTLLLVVPLAVVTTAGVIGRMRPTEIDIRGSWAGYAHPSRPIAELALALTIATLVLAPRGTWRRRASAGAGALLLAVVLARVYTAVDHPSDALAGLVAGVAAPIVALRLLTPEEAFPVTYRRGVRAHLDVGGRRGEAIRHALANQLDVQVVEVEPFSLHSSAGSTPLLIETSSGPLFGKLYASVHLRSDRWYKLARTVRYGRLEDELPFNSVRRLVQYEDHMLRVLRDAGVPTATPLGIVEITPEREYLLVVGLIPGAVHLTAGDVTVEVVDQALGAVRALWDAGLAHRDIKPSNVLLAEGRVWLIDVAFAEVRPSPWRQAVDLANMMLTLALCVPPEVVYERATRLFTPDEVAEAFAASRAVTVPAQLRALLRERDDDPAAAFRALAPDRPPVAIQRWSLRRVGLTLAVAAGSVVALALAVTNLHLAGLL